MKIEEQAAIKALTGVAESFGFVAFAFIAVIDKPENECYELLTGGYGDQDLQYNGLSTAANKLYHEGTQPLSRNESDFDRYETE